MAIDANGKIYAFHRAEPPIVEIDSAGKILKRWGEGMFVWPHGIRVDQDGFLWVTDGRARDGKGQQVFKMTPDGKVVMTLGTKGVAGDGPDAFNGVCDVAFGRNGDIFVADGHVNARIVKFTKDGKFIKSWGSKGTGHGQFDLPHAIVIDRRGRVLVARSLEQPHSDLRPGGRVSRRVDAVRHAERHVHRRRRHAVRGRLQREEGHLRREREGRHRAIQTGRRRGGRCRSGS